MTLNVEFSWIEHIGGKSAHMLSSCLGMCDTFTELLKRTAAPAFGYVTRPRFFVIKFTSGD